MAKRPSVTLRCVADHYAIAGERIVEVSFPDGAGCLVSLRTFSDGTNVIEVYRADDKIEARGPGLAGPFDTAKRKGE